MLLAGHLLALYWPRVEIEGLPQDSDKLAHALLFGLPAVAAALVLRRPAWLLAPLAVHAPVSEWLQASVLPHRSGDVRDALADLAGVLVGAVVGQALRRRRARAREGAGGPLSR